MQSEERKELKKHKFLRLNSKLSPQSLRKPLNSLRHRRLRRRRKRRAEKHLVIGDAARSEPGTFGDENAFVDGGQEDCVFDFGVRRAGFGEGVGFPGDLDPVLVFPLVI